MHRRLGVLSLTNTLGFAGGEARVLSFAKTIDRDRFDHYVVCVKRANAEQAPEDAAMRSQFAAAGIKVIDLDQGYSKAKIARPTHSMKVLINGVKRLCELVNLHNIDIIDAHLAAASLMAVLSARRAGVRAAVTSYQAADWSGTLGLESK